MFRQPRVAIIGVYMKENKKTKIAYWYVETAFLAFVLSKLNFN
jgi:hypothetical protein